MHRPILTTPPAEEPVTLAEARLQCRVDGTDEDSLIAGYISAAVAHLDGWAGVLGRCMVTQTWRQDCDDWDRILRLPFPDVTAVVVSYDDTANDPQVVDAAEYQTLEDARGCYLRFADSFTSPTVGPDRAGIHLSLTAGYGAAADVPQPLRNAILAHVQGMFGRGDDSEKWRAVHHDLIRPYRRVNP